MLPSSRRGAGRGPGRAGPQGSCRRPRRTAPKGPRPRGTGCGRAWRPSRQRPWPRGPPPHPAPPRSAPPQRAAGRPRGAGSHLGGAGGRAAAAAGWRRRGRRRGQSARRRPAELSSAAMTAARAGREGAREAGAALARMRTTGGQAPTLCRQRLRVGRNHSPQGAPLAPLSEWARSGTSALSNPPRPLMGRSTQGRRRSPNLGLGRSATNRELLQRKVAGGVPLAVRERRCGYGALPEAAGSEGPHGHSRELTRLCALFVRCCQRWRSCWTVSRGADSGSSLLAAGRHVGGEAFTAARVPAGFRRDGAGARLAVSPAP